MPEVSVKFKRGHLHRVAKDGVETGDFDQYLLISQKRCNTETWLLLTGTILRSTKWCYFQRPSMIRYDKIRYIYDRLKADEMAILV